MNGTRTPDWILERLHTGYLPPEEAAPLAAKILKSVFPRPGLVDRLAENLLK